MANIVNKIDRRARLQCKAEPGSPTFTRLFGEDTPSNILEPLHRTKGVLFPYTPNVQFTSGASYQEISPVHSNYSFNVFEKAFTGPFVVDTMFTAQTHDEARYMLAVMHFFKVITKMDFGEQAGSNRGVPPPVMNFNYLGQHMFNKIPVVVRSVNYMLENGVDYVPVRFESTDKRDSYVPTQLSLSFEIAVQMNTKQVRKDFNLKSFTNGSYLDGAGDGAFGGWI